MKILIYTFMAFLVSVPFYATKYAVGLPTEYNTKFISETQRCNESEKDEHGICKNNHHGSVGRVFRGGGVHSGK